MKEKINQKGFIQIPILVAIIMGVLVLSGASYVGIKQYQKSGGYQKTNTSEVEKLKQEIEELKKTTLQNQNKLAVIKKENTSVTATEKKVILTNAQIIAKIRPAIVYIETNKGSGTGMIIESNGLVLTNAHVIKGATSIKIILSDKRVLTAESVGRDEIKDIALIKANATNLTIVKLGNSNIVAQGDEVFTLGYPFGIEGDVSFKEGTISRRLSEGDGEYFEISAEIHPGNSGGPLVNKYGEVVGVNSAMIGQKIGGIIVGETIKLAIPIDVAKNLIDDLKLGKDILPPKPVAFDEFEIFVKNLEIASNLYSEALQLSENASSLASDGKYNTALSKMNQAINTIWDAIAQLKNIAVYVIPSVPFSKTISELVALNITLYEKYDFEIMMTERRRYEVMSKPYIDIDSEIEKLTLVNNLLDSTSDLYDKREEFTTKQYFPKLVEYAKHAKPYLDIIYPK